MSVDPELPLTNSMDRLLRYTFGSVPRHTAHVHVGGCGRVGALAFRPATVSIQNGRKGFISVHLETSSEIYCLVMHLQDLVLLRVLIVH